MCCKCLSVIYDQEHALLRARPRASVSLALRALKACCCCCCCWTGTMEEKHTDESDKDPQSASYQRRMWRNFQEKTKPFLSPKLGSERRSGDSKKESGLWMFKRKKKQVLDRVFSSSQPNLSSTPPSLVCDSTLCEEPDSSASKGLGISPLAVADGASVSKPEISVSAHGSPKLLVAQLAMSHQKSSSLGSTCFEKLVVDSAASSEDELAKNAIDLGINIVEASNEELHPPSKPGMYQLDIVLKKGNNLAIRDRGGTSDPYVKFKIAGKEVFRSKTIHKNLNPVWEEKVSLLVESLREPLYVKVFDYDFGLQDDFMGSAYLYLESLEHQRTLDVTIELKDPHYPNHDLGSLDLTVTLIPKEGDFRETTMLMRRSWKRSSKHQSLRLSDIHRKAQLWRGIVSISLIEAHNLQPMDANGLSDPYVKFRMGHQKYKSKTIPKTLNPQWREQFDFHLFDEQGGFIDVTVWDKDAGKKDDFMGRCQVDLSLLSKECTHRLDVPLDEGEGTLVLLVTLTASAAVSIADLSVNILDDPRERKEILHRYSLLRSFNNIKDVGMVQVKVIRAEGLMAADVTGKSDPFCVVELSNDRLQTHTVYKNLNPEWNKVFTFNVKDIHSVLEVTVYDEDRDRSADFLGKVAIPLLNIQNGERKAYALKSKELTGPTKGVIFLEIDVIYNIVKAGMRTLIPIEQKYIEEEPRVSKQMLLQNFNRMRRCIMFLINAGCYINSCFEWESPQRSICAFLLFFVVVWNFELYMVPLVLLMLLTWNYVLIASGKDTRQGDVQAVEDLLEDEEEDFDRDDKVPGSVPSQDGRLPESHILADILASWHFEWIRVMVDSERKGFMNKLYAIQDVCISVQNALDEVASYGERIKNTFNWTVPFLSWLAIVALCAATLVVYYIPIRYIVLAWGVNKFTKKLRDPYSIDNNELLDFLSRVPSDVQVVQYRELKVDPSPSPNKRKKNNLG
ncbi:multiple C2 and transmembrane domain-containing protein 1 isoform X4 [Rhinichthys klamathensis goyatoka]|uniref:multiple C2 and transmembrane domain-containing protein 1 isoform X4 n=1 Tax=Rhinichthys klamathensis goyatoka TaxID=3034132 RepID=UPI0024B581EC|nr:multiple C2 and transmembrane domain-containing protein 1 isoform X4 [Rhinichthys klamathensis goyatoka]